MDQAYCPYCGEKIPVRGQTSCTHCGAEIIDIWKLLNSGLQPPPLVRPAPSQPKSMDWIGPAMIIALGLVLFLLVLVSMLLTVPWLADWVARFTSSGLNLLKTAWFCSSPLAGLG